MGQNYAIVTGANAFMSPRAVWIDYTNYRGERGVREVVPLGIRFGATEHHPEPQWLMDAYDVQKEAERTFAMNDVHAWGLKGEDA